MVTEAQYDLIMITRKIACENTVWMQMAEVILEIFWMENTCQKCTKLRMNGQEFAEKAEAEKTQRLKSNRLNGLKKLNILKAEQNRNKT